MLKNNILVSTVVRIIKLLPANFKRKAFVVFFLLFLNSILELMGLAAILPVIMFMLQDNAIENNKYLLVVYNFLGISSPELFFSFISLAVLSLILVKNLATVWIAKYQSAFAYSLYQYFSTNLFKYYYNKGALYFKENNSSKIAQNINAIPLDFANTVVVNTLTALNEITIMMLIVISILIYDPLIVLLLVSVVLPVFILFYRKVKDKLHAIQVSLYKITPEINKNIFQSIYGYVDVMMANAEEEFRKRHSNLIGKVLPLHIQDKVYQLAPARVIETAVIAAVILLALYGVYFIEDKSHLIGLISIFALAAYRILPSINKTVLAIMGIKSRQFTFDTVSLVKENIELKADNRTANFAFSDNITLSNIYFSYPKGKTVLNNITLKIKKGQKIGLIGRSGSGKSTIVNLLLGFLHPSKGELSVDGKKLEKSQLAGWRSCIAYVPQDVFMLDATLAENVAFGVEKERIDYDRVEGALRLARLGDFLEQLPNKLETMIGDRGALVSGGQRQRIGIARALYKNVNILVLDEATSALDNNTEQELTEALKGISETGLTVIIIAHRLTTLRDCDIIYEMEEGSIIHSWNYKDLFNEKLVIKEQNISH
ncbi:ABC transporter ATP-binding protein [Botryobacter ruber]|uniref:ABC transporter ATP-binding protein n=1 Tax=Botryobacter ruber TaxID=2171629 RepID=UPI000E0AC403|nr:ABC transporter ATP-binding protein [Botryobacter ruber]